MNTKITQTSHLCHHVSSQITPQEKSRALKPVFIVAKPCHCHMMHRCPKILFTKSLHWGKKPCEMTPLTSFEPFGPIEFGKS